VLLDKIIFDKGSSITVEVLVIHNKEQQPRVSALGKIAGLEQIAITNSFQGHDQQSFWEQALRGNSTIQIMRTLIYGFAALLSVIALGLIIAGAAWVRSRLKRARRHKQVSRFLQTEDSERSKKLAAVGEIYIEHGLDGLSTAAQELTHEAYLKDLLADPGPALFSPNGPFLGDDGLPDAEMRHRHLTEHMMIRQSETGPLRKAGLIRLDDDVLFIDPELKQLIEHFKKLMS
jgi:uncharacterized membrane protein YciS (DUF1049 family)